MSDDKKETKMDIKSFKSIGRLTNFDKLPNQGLLSAKELAILSGRSRTSLWRDVTRGSLAEPVKIGNRTVKWRVADVRQFLNGGV